GVEYYTTAFTRAREHITVLTAIHPHEINFDNLMSGAYHFWDLLSNLPDSSEPAQQATQTTALDHLSDDFVQHLADRGADYHCDTHGFADLYLYTPAKYRLQHATDYQPVAVAYDGAARHHHTALRTRTRTIPAQLAQLGWRNKTLWAIDVFTDPIGITDSYADLLQLPRKTETTETQTSSVDVDNTVDPQNIEE